jgi:hypothetical protein
VDHVGVDAEGDGGVGVAEAGSDDVHRGAGHQERRGVDVAHVVEAGWGSGARGFCLLWAAMSLGIRELGVSGKIGSPQPVVKT